MSRKLHRSNPLSRRAATSAASLRAFAASQRATALGGAEVPASACCSARACHCVFAVSCLAAELLDANREFVRPWMKSSAAYHSAIPTHQGFPQQAQADSARVRHWMDAPTRPEASSKICPWDNYLFL